MIRIVDAVASSSKIEAVASPGAAPSRPGFSSQREGIDVMRFGAPEVQAGWVQGRTVVLAAASVITMGPDGDLVGDIVISDATALWRWALVRGPMWETTPCGSTHRARW